MRLVFLITPTQELNKRLGVGEGFEVEAFGVTAVITPELHYERHFEGWRKSWREKAKFDFISDFIETWGDQDDSIGEVAKELKFSEKPLELFERLWNFSQGEDVLEIAPEWRPE